MTSIDEFQTETVIVHAVYVTTQGCVWITTTRQRPLTVVVLVMDVLLLIATLIGLAYRGALKKEGLWRTLYFQVSAPRPRNPVDTDLN